MTSSSNGAAIPILSLVKSAQQQHGLRHGDYQRYHQYISRKLRRMRKSLHFQQGNRSKVLPKKLTSDIITDPRFIILAVFEIERSWAYAMQLKGESNTELRKRFQMLSRLRKAVSRAESLCSMEDDLPLLDAQTKLELRAYRQWIRGILLFELQDWVKAKEYLESAQAIYDILLQMVDEDNRNIYKSRIEDLLPQVRYCAYTIGDESAATELQRLRTQTPSDSGLLAEMQLDQLLVQARASQASQVTEVEWLGTTIPVKLEKAKIAVLTAKESIAELEKAEGHQAKLTIYESLLKSCVEAMTSIRDELRMVSASEASATGDKNSAAVIATTKSGHVIGSDKVSRLQLLYSYLQYLKLSNTIDRTSLHIEVALSSGSLDPSHVKFGFATSIYSKPQELSRLYDTIVQNFQELISLTLIQNHDGLKDLLYAKMLANRSFRCYYLALAYNHGKKYAECSALLTRAKKHAEKALSSLSPKASTWNQAEESVAPGPNSDSLIESLRMLTQQAESEELTCRAACMLDTVEATEHMGISSSPGTLTDAEVAQKVLMDRLDIYINDKDVGKSLATTTYPFVHLPPEFEPVPVKPIFFDLALNYITFPSLADKIDSRTAGSSKSSGLTGLMRGWLWGVSDQVTSKDTS